MISSSNALREARRMFVTSYEQELEEKGVLPPSRNCSPLWPPWSDVEYEAMERDTSKYFLYFSAINAAFSDFKRDETNTVNILVLGPGRGRLVDYSIDCLTQNNLQGMTHVIESNISCCQVLQDKYRDATNVCVHPPITIRDSVEALSYIQSEHAPSSIRILTNDKNIDIIISELFGSFSDNEFMPEILSACIELFGGEKCFSIPAEYESSVIPIFSPTLQRYFDKYESDDGCVESVFVLGLPDDAIFLTNSQKLWKCSCCFSPPVNQSIVKFGLGFENQFHALSASVESNCSKSKFHGNSNENMIPVLSCKDNIGQPLDTKSVSLSTPASGSASLGQSNSIKLNISNETLNHRSFAVTGFAVHFTASLYKDIVIDTRPGHSRNTYFWESAFLPLNLATRSKLDNVINCRNDVGLPVFSLLVRRVIKNVGQFDEKTDLNCKTDCWCNSKIPVHHLHYEWSIIAEYGENIGNVHNENGESHVLYL